MAKKDIFSNMNLTDMSYLVDPSVNAKGVTDEGTTKKGKEPETQIPIYSLKPFKNHPFRVDTEGESFEQLIESVRKEGVIYPILVRPSGDGYEIIAGHRRAAACQAAGMETIPAVVRSLDDYEATILMVHTNFYREEIRISEKARAYRMCIDAEKHQGKKGGNTAELVGNGQDSKRQVYRYVRLSYLTNDLLELLDAGRLPVNVGVELSYLNSNTQTVLKKFIDEYGILPNVEQATELRKLSGAVEDQESGLSYEIVVATLVTGMKKKASNKVSFKTKELAGYFDEGTDAESMSQVILMLLEKYRNGDFEGLLGEAGSEDSDAEDR